MNYSKILSPIEKELVLVENRWRACFQHAENPVVENLNFLMVNSAGKRLRPALTILSACALNGDNREAFTPDLISAATAVEMLHAASLIHDDVIDSAPFRHDKPTINSSFGSDASIAFGDYIYSLSIKLTSDLNNPLIFKSFARSTSSLCEGELIQIIERKNFDLVPEQYFSIIKRKTASLFALSCELGALVADSDNSREIVAMADFGLNFGMAYQISDDIRDIVGSRAELGKDPGVDFCVEELTLPLILLLKDPKSGPETRHLLSMKDRATAFEKIRQIALESNALAVARDFAIHHLNNSRTALIPTSDSVYKSSLLALTDWLLEKI
ncbi:MAG: polyprenyl synthetase family protein [Candidatus Riflebacteria bacterium]|nr:polyprenyl synthetase family protein [Candidatus Riflebacteria bacterium]